VFRSHLKPSSRPRELYTKIHKNGFNHGIRALALIICPYTVIKTVFTSIYCIFVYSSLGREDGCRSDMTETRNVIPSLEFKT